MPSRDRPPQTEAEPGALRGDEARAVGAFFGLTFLVSWSLWFAVLEWSGARAYPPSVLGLLMLPGTFAPAIVALGMTARAEGGVGAGVLLSRLFVWQVPGRWYLFALGYMAAVKLLAAVAVRLLTGDWPVFGPVPLYLLLVAAIFSTPFQAGEEIGWRGYALPRLATLAGLPGASVLLGVIWAAWHLPLFYLTGADLTGQSFPVFALSVTALSVAMAWLYASTGGSLLLVMLMHAAVNNTTGVVPAATPEPVGVLSFDATVVGWITTALLWIGAVYFLVRMQTEPGRVAEGVS